MISEREKELYKTLGETQYHLNEVLARLSKDNALYFGRARIEYNKYRVWRHALTGKYFIGRHFEDIRKEVYARYGVKSVRHMNWNDREAANDYAIRRIHYYALREVETA